MRNEVSVEDRKPVGEARGSDHVRRYVWANKGAYVDGMKGVML